MHKTCHWRLYPQSLCLNNIICPKVCNFWSQTSRFFSICRPRLCHYIWLNSRCRCSSLMSSEIDWWWWRKVWTGRTVQVMRLSNERGRRTGRSLLALTWSCLWRVRRVVDRSHISADSSRCNSLKMGQFGWIQNHVMVYLSKSGNCITGMCSTVNLIWHQKQGCFVDSDPEI